MSDSNGGAKELDLYKDKLKNTIKELISANRLDEAQTLIKQYEEIIPNDVEMYSIKAVACIMQNQSEAAEEILLEGLKLDANNFDMLYNLAYLYEVKDNFKKANKYYLLASRSCTDGELYNELQRKINDIKLALKKVPKKVLVVAHIFPPLGGSGVQRTLKFVKYFRENGWEPIVITVGKTINSYLIDETLINEVPKDISVIRIDEIGSLEKTDLEELVKMHADIIQSPKLIGLYIENINKGGDYLQNCLTIPDHSALWAKNVIKEIENLVDLEEIDLIYSTSGPYSDHIVAYNLKLKYNLPWVVDFRDEWTNNPHAKYNKEGIRYKMESIMEGNIVRLADKVITVTETSTNNYIEKFNLPADKVLTITNGYDENDFIDLEDKNEKNEKFTIVHNGLLYQIRTPESFIYAVHNLITKGLVDRKKFKAILGLTDDDKYKKLINKLGLDNNIEFIDYLSHEDSLNLANSADTLLLIIGEEPELKSVYTGKVFEYLRLGKPILALSPSGSLVEKLLERTGRGVNLEFRDMQGIESHLLRMYKEWEEGKLKKIPLDNSIKSFERQELTKRLVEVFEDSLNSNGLNRKKIAFFMIQGGDSFIDHITIGLSSDYQVKKVIVTDLKQIDKWMNWADICWFEWCDKLIIYGSNLELAQQKKIICRLHSYEAFSEFPSQVNWSNIDKLIFVAEYIKKIVTEKIKIDTKKCVIIPNGVDLNKYSFREKDPGFNVAFVGYIDYKKGPMLLLHTFKAIYDRDHRYKLYIAGKFTDERYSLYFQQMIEEFKMQDNVIFQGWQDNINQWLEDKDYILCTSVLESQNMSVMQAMAKGIKPIVHNFVGAKFIYPKEIVWNSIEEAVDMVLKKNNESLKYRKFIENEYSLNKEIKSIRMVMEQITNDI